MNNLDLGQLTAVAAAIVAVAAGYTKAMGKAQCQIVAWVISALAVRSRYRGVLNLAVGILLAALFSGLTAWVAGDVRLLAIGIVAGLFASVEAANVHDAAAERPRERPPPTP